MKNTYIADWQKIYDRFEGWWNREETSRPLMNIIAEGKRGNPVPLAKPAEPAVLYLDPHYIVANYRNFCETHYFLADAFPKAGVDLGPGSMTLYLGGEPGFAWDTLWYHEFLDDAAEFEKLCFDPRNKWWIKHQEIIREAVKLADGDFYVTIPDIMENLDILSAMRGPQNFCFDIIDEGEAVRRGVNTVDDLYFVYYNTIYDMVKTPDDIAAFTAFNILGKGKIAKVQCDFSAMISPEMFREFVQPSLRKQCRKLTRSLYHLDGPDAIKHVEALMEIKELDALQWTCGAGKPDGACERWYPIYDKVHDAGKGLWIQLYDGDPEDWAEGAKRLVKRYGKKGMYLLPPVFPDLQTAEQFASMFD
jgi:5-methyltetrahydrofolate--homocysteine methyltransferase